MQCTLNNFISSIIFPFPVSFSHFKQRLVSFIMPSSHIYILFLVYYSALGILLQQQKMDYDITLRALSY